ncbi:MAG: tRNA pseudouridine(55) synthase TruB [Lachnospiraceae bacterium]|jgi:tRNA pseudouridine55 synthase|nr:tRNA pseudouridine(55) synthase TruB [Lachnospiraceae bacterium]
MSEGYPYNGVIIVNKEAGFTSHDVVAVMRGIFGQRKVGHTGTLDPQATGVLPICLGSATKQSEALSAKNKTYRTVLLLGKTTDTQDITGKVLSECEFSDAKDSNKKDEILSVIKSFIGKQEQIPPMYSAVKINGKKLYELARAGKEVERKPKSIEVYDIRVLSVELPRVEFEIDCSKGTYIRTICHDIGAHLGCGGCMESLVRLKSGEFDINIAHTLEQIRDKISEGNIDEWLIKV